MMLDSWPGEEPDYLDYWRLCDELNISKAALLVAEHGDPAYIINLVKRVVRASIETMRIVKALPALEERVR